jgi:hypothetical protein
MHPFSDRSSVVVMMVPVLMGIAVVTSPVVTVMAGVVVVRLSHSIAIGNERLWKRRIRYGSRCSVDTDQRYSRKRNRD